jgi:hypothetical protein
VIDPQQRQYLAGLAREGQRKAWWARYGELLPRGADYLLGLEAAATMVRTFSVQTIPGLLQTPEYAAAIIRAARPGLPAEQTEALVTARMRRQELRYGQRELHAVIDESALLRTVGSAPVMAGQLDHLASRSSASRTRPIPTPAGAAKTTSTSRPSATAAM